jgi:hypothetical protein
MPLVVDRTCASCWGCAPNAPGPDQRGHAGDRAGARTGGVVPTGQHERDELLAVEHIRRAEDAERGEAPVDGVEAEVRGEVVREVVRVLCARRSCVPARAGERAAPGRAL